MAEKRGPKKPTQDDLSNLEMEDAHLALAGERRDEAARAAVRSELARQARVAASGRCQCTGECGATHAWNADVKRRPCRALHGSTIVRKTDYPSFWQLSPGNGSGELAYPEFYTLKEIDVVLLPVTVTSPKGDRIIVACQRCKLLIQRGEGAAPKD